MPSNFPPRALSLFAFWSALFFSPPTSANDRPFQIARTAIWEDDEDLTWSIETWLQRYGSVRSLSVEPEHDFGGGLSLQIELGRLLDRLDAQTGYEGEIEFKQLFNHIGNDGYGWGLSAAVGVERTQVEGTTRHLSLKLPLSIALGAHGYVHLNPGINFSTGRRPAFTSSAAIAQEVSSRAVVFAELGRERDQRFRQVGVRYWLKREKLALDFSLQLQRGEGQRSAGFIIGLGAYEF